MDIDVDITKEVLETERLVLRAFCETDLDDFFEYASVEGVGEMAGWKHHENIEVSKQILSSFMSGHEVLAIVYKENNKVIGSVGLHKSWANADKDFEHLKMKEVGYVLSKAYWGHGLMHEAVSTLIKVCFDKYGLDAMTCSHFISNSQSKRVIEKCGFKFVRQGQFFSEQLNQSIDDIKYILYRQQ